MDSGVGLDAGGGVEESPGRSEARRRESGIYGAIITAAILAALRDTLTAWATAVAVVVTLTVYWLAEQYAEVLAEQTHGGQVPTWRTIRASLGSTWPTVSSSFLPLAALLAARAVGASPLVAVNVGLIAAIVLLTAHAWRAARSAQLHHWRLVAVTSIAAALGLVMVALKDLVLLHLH